jgi:hypothetical protein
LLALALEIKKDSNSLSPKYGNKKAGYPYIGHPAVKRLDYSYIKLELLTTIVTAPLSSFRGQT